MDSENSYDPNWNSMGKKKTMVNHPKWSIFSEKEQRYLLLRFREIDIFKSVKDDNKHKNPMLMDILETKFKMECEVISEEQEEKANEFLMSIFHNYHSKDIEKGVL